MLVDLGKFVVHAMLRSTRLHYDIEGLWNSIAETQHDEGSDDSSELKQVAMQWSDRPASLVKTKQLEEEDMLDEQKVLDKVNLGRQPNPT